MTMPWSPSSSPKPAFAERLLDETLVAGLRGLALPRRRSRASTEGTHRGMRGGAGEDFFQHRVYVPGEDVRRIDHRASARYGQLLVKELHRSPRQPLVVVVDTSASMAFWGKQRCAGQLGAALAVLAVRRGDPVMLVGLEGPRLRAWGRVLAAAQPSLAVEAMFAALPSAGRAELFAALQQPSPVALTGAHLVVLSDCYGTVGPTFARLRAQVAALTVVHVFAENERVMPAGFEQLRDAETGDELPVPPGTDQAFSLRVEAWRQALRREVHHQGGEWLEADPAVPAATLLRLWLA
jgi:uncharacterized protein (DUF58 family)